MRDIDLAMEAADLPGWEYLPRMAVRKREWFLDRNKPSLTVLDLPKFGEMVCCTSPVGHVHPSSLRPDLDDPATVGVMLQQLRKRYPHHHISTWQNEHAERSPGAFAAWVQVYDPVLSETQEFDHESLAGAIIRAWRAAP